MENKIKKQTIFMSSKLIRFLAFVIFPIALICLEYFLISYVNKWYWILLCEIVILLFVWMLYVYSLTRIVLYDTYFKVYLFGCKRVDNRDVKEISCIDGLSSGAGYAYDLWFIMKNEEESFRVQYFQLRSKLLFFTNKSAKKALEKVMDRVKEIVLKKQ